MQALETGEGNSGSVGGCASSPKYSAKPELLTGLANELNFGTNRINERRPQWEF